MQSFQRFTGYCLIALNALLIFFAVFLDKLEFPIWLQAIGRAHPLLLHLPIGAIVILALVFIFRKDATPTDPVRFLVAFAALTGGLSALMGMILSKEGGYNESTLGWHEYTGLLVSLVLAAIFFAQDAATAAVIRLSGLVSFILLIVAGHYGSVLTHGEDFILEPLLSQRNTSVQVTDSTSLFDAAVMPVLEKKCNSCHNPSKSKGGLVMTSSSGLYKGGEHGNAVAASNPFASLLMKRVLLPEQHRDHMPPNGKPQLSALEVQLLYQWILTGADTSKAWTLYAPSDSVRKLAQQLVRSSQAEKKAKYTFQAASTETISKLNDPYRTVTPVATNEPALVATFFIRNEYKSAKLEELKSISSQLVELNLSKMPVSDADCQIIAGFQRLEKLNINFSSITGEGLKALSTLPELTSLSIAGTSLNASAMESLRSFPALKEVFIWNTQLSTQDVTTLETEIPTIKWNTGFVPNENERLRLTSPIPALDKTLFAAGEKIELVHKLPGTVIRYSTDGSDPDSTSSKEYSGPFQIDGFTVLKTRACKTGWLCSPIGTFILFQSGITPSNSKLLTAPNKDYKGEGVATFTNNRKGYTDDHRDNAWIGFRDNPLVAEFTFDKSLPSKSVTLSYDRNLGSWLFPPASVEIWVGTNEKDLKLLKRVQPEQPSQMESTKNAAIVVPLDGNSYSMIKVVATPVRELPKWHPSNNPKTKDKRAWLFVDEIIFN